MSAVVTLWAGIRAHRPFGSDLVCEKEGRKPSKAQQYREIAADTPLKGEMDACFVAVSQSGVHGGKSHLFAQDTQDGFFVLQDSRHRGGRKFAGVVFKEPIKDIEHTAHAVVACFGKGFDPAHQRGGTTEGLVACRPDLEIGVLDLRADMDTLPSCEQIAKRSGELEQEFGHLAAVWIDSQRKEVTGALLLGHLRDKAAAIVVSGEVLLQGFWFAKQQLAVGRKGQ